MDDPQLTPARNDPRRWMRVRRAGDVLAITLAVGAALAAGPHTAPDLVSALAFALTSLGLMYSRRRQLAVGVLDSCTRAIAACAVGAMVAIALQALAGAADGGLLALRLWLMGASSACACRIGFGMVQRRARARGLLMTPTLVVGAGVVGEWVVRRLTQQPALGLDPIGFLDAEPLEEDSTLPVLGAPEDAVEIARRTGARQLVFAFSWERDHRLAEVVRRCQAAGLEVAIVPRLWEAVTERATLDHVGGLPLMGFRPLNFQGWRFTLKYAFDRVFAAAVLCSLAPFMLAVALAVRLSSPGPVIYRQRRVGRHGREFDLLKFRSMTAEPGPGPFALPAGLAPGGVEGADRRTPVGRWLRNTSLDELPQLINVLRGEMSLVGPRPERPEFVAEFADEVPGYQDRHRVKPGITGWAQVNGLRGPTSITDRVEWDNHYIENWSFQLELKILALTTAAVLSFREQTGPLLSSGEEELVVPQPSPPHSGPGPAPSPEPGPLTPPSPAAPAPSAGPTPGPAPEPAPSPAAAAKPALRLVASAPAETFETHWFCGYCGQGAAGPTPPPVSRVCESCATGLLLEAPADTAPGSGEAFLVVDSRLTVQAVSREAEQMLGVCETEVTDQPITDLLTDADVELDHPDSFAAALAGAAMNDDDRRSSFVRPRDDYGIRIRARISYCGPPRAALIVLESPKPEDGPRLRLVQSEPLKAAEPGRA